MSGRHAFLIIAHEQPRQLQVLVDLLDHPRNDLYLQTDSGGAVPPGQIRAARSSLVSLAPMPIHWAGFSQIEAELRLLQAAVQDPHDYYHLLSGADLPLVPPAVLHERLATSTVEYLALTPAADEFARWKVHYRHPFVETRHYRRHKALRVVSHGLVKAQQALGVRNRLTRELELRHGSAYFSITHECARFVLDRREWIRAAYRHSIAADEVFLPTLLTSDGGFRISDQGQDGPGNLRHIDWGRRVGNSPHTFDMDDLESLRSAARTKCFARKFDLAAAPEVVRHVQRSLTSSGHL